MELVALFKRFNEDCNALSPSTPHRALTRSSSRSSNSRSPWRISMPVDGSESWKAQSRGPFSAKRFIGTITPPHGHSDPPATGHVDDQTTTRKPTKMPTKKSIMEHTTEAHDKPQPIWKMCMKALSRYARPAVPKGYRRIEWTCVG